ncbi:MAG: hypothetical protein JW745_00870 [Sedimentisphaerales bacterium]|nr:hypothetical protein [Sedimentisphaerales bacterium]MBN2842393.1 hypothetical protein [Sedimentisphaerales bacterium]
MLLVRLGDLIKTNIAVVKRVAVIYFCLATIFEFLRRYMSGNNFVESDPMVLIVLCITVWFGPFMCKVQLLNSKLISGKDIISVNSILPIYWFGLIIGGLSIIASGAGLIANGIVVCLRIDCWGVVLVGTGISFVIAAIINKNKFFQNNKI